MKKLAIILFLSACLWAAEPYRILNSFNAGELSPLLNTREDLAKFQSGCSVMENMLPLPQGGAQKRPGTVYVAGSKEDTKIRLLPFQFSTSQSYVIEAGNQYLRFFTSNAQITGSTGESTSSFPQQGSLEAHWKLNETAGTSINDSSGSHTGTFTANTAGQTRVGQVGNALDMAGAFAVEVPDDAGLSFGNGTVDTKFSFAVWIFVEETAARQTIISKYNNGVDFEYRLSLVPTEELEIRLFDDDVGGSYLEMETDDALSNGWRHIVVTYDATEAASGLTLYVDGVGVDQTADSAGAYVSMVDTAADFVIGANNNAGALADFFANKIDNVIVWNGVELSSAEVTTLYNLQTATGAYEIDTPYLTADLFELKFEQSADVLYITHPDYETKKLLRFGDTAWSLQAINIQTGPFRTQNFDTSFKIAASATTGSVTLTATGGAPFVSGTIAGHLPSGATATDKSNTGALFKIVHPLDTLEFKDTLEDDIGASQTEGVSWMSCGTIFQGGGWKFTTGGTWLGTVEVQRNYTIGAAVGNGPDKGASVGWETVFQFSGVTTARNIATTLRTEDAADANYRVIFADDTSGTVLAYFDTDQTEQVGIVEITAVASTTSATGTVIKTLGSTNATYKWSESSWSNYRGWPQTVAFFEDRLMFGGNPSQPDTVWGSQTGQYENMLAGADDSDAVLFTLTSRQVNAIEWIVGKDRILIGTSGAEWTLSGAADEPLTPSNVKAEQHSTYGSSGLQAGIANESTLFFQRGAKRMRELAYNWELDSYVAPDMTILAKEVTGEGVTEMAFQQIPDAILWCIREDGEIATFSYERKENITAWSRVITDGDFESVAVISGSSEDQVWVSVEREINSSTVRYIEYFNARDFGTDLDDAFYVDSGITYDSTATTTITGLDHLEAESVSVFGDSVIQTSQTVASGQITITSASTVQAGMPYTVQMKTMPLSFPGAGMSILGKKKRVSEVIAFWHNSGDFSVGKDASTLQTHSISGMTTSEDRTTFPPGFNRNGQVFLYQQSPEPLTVLALGITFEVD